MQIFLTLFVGYGDDPFHVVRHCEYVSSDALFVNPATTTVLEELSRTPRILLGGEI